MSRNHALLYALVAGSCMLLWGCPRYYALQVDRTLLDDSSITGPERKVTLAIEEFDYEARFRGQTFLVIDHGNHGIVSRMENDRWAVDPAILVNQMIRESCRTAPWLKNVMIVSPGAPADYIMSGKIMDMTIHGSGGDGAPDYVTVAIAIDVRAWGGAGNLKPPILQGVFPVTTKEEVRGRDAKNVPAAFNTAITRGMSEGLKQLAVPQASSGTIPLRSFFAIDSRQRERTIQVGAPSAGSGAGIWQILDPQGVDDGRFGFEKLSSSPNRNLFCFSTTSPVEGLRGRIEFREENERYTLIVSGVTGATGELTLSAPDWNTLRRWFIAELYPAESGCR